jgi:hypothetical protein
MLRVSFKILTLEIDSPKKLKKAEKLKNEAVYVSLNE